MECKHIFIGKADGVHCKLCSLHMTPDQYKAHVEPTGREQTEKQPPKRGRKKVQC